jgi:molecular chaperone Hsp33
METNDRVVRAMTRDGSFRVVAACTTRTVGEIVRAQKAAGTGAGVLADLGTLGVLYRETMAPSQRVQITLRGANGTGHVVVDSHPDGWARGLLRTHEGVDLDLRGEDAVLQLQRPLRSGELHMGTVAIPEDGRIASAAMAYFGQSEQITTMVALGTVLTDDDDSRVAAAGGFLVQVLPEARELEGPLAVMMLRLEEFIDIRDRLRATDASPEVMIEEILYGFEFDWLATSPIRFGCVCGEERLLASLATLDAATVAELAASAEPIESRCEYCGTVYRIAPQRLAGLLRKA